MKDDVHRICRNREAVIKGTALFWLMGYLLIICCMAGAIWVRYDFSFAQIDPIFWKSISRHMWINVLGTYSVASAANKSREQRKWCSFLRTRLCDLRMPWERLNVSVK